MLLKFLGFLLIEPAVSVGLIGAGGRLFQLANRGESPIRSKRIALLIAAAFLGLGVAVGIHFVVNLIVIMENPK